MSDNRITLTQYSEYMLIIKGGFRTGVFTHLNVADTVFLFYVDTLNCIHDLYVYYSVIIFKCHELVTLILV